MASTMKLLFAAGLVLILLVLLSSSSGFAMEEIVFGPQEFKISQWHLDVSYNSFSLEGPRDGRLLIRKEYKTKKINAGFVLLNDQGISLHDFLKGDDQVFEQGVDLRFRNYLSVFVTGTPGAVLSLEIRAARSIVPGPEVEFTALPEIIKPGETCTLRWTSTYAEHVWIDQGIGDVETSGFVNVSPTATTEYRLTATGQGGSTTKSVRVEVRGGVEILITSPKEGEQINRSHVAVKGFVGSAEGMETGVNVNGVVALVYGREFAANRVPMQDGENLITATAVDGTGNRVEASVNVHGHIEPGGMIVSAYPDAGIAPFEATLRIEGLSGPSYPSFSFAGPGVVELLETTDPTMYDMRIQTPGLYAITAELQDEEGRAQEDTIAILVMEWGALDAMLKKKWAAMGDALAAGDVGAAMTHISQRSKNMYEYNFSLLSGFLGEIAAGLEDIEMVQVQDKAAEYEMWAEQGGQRYSFYVLFVKDRDGIWRIEFF
jgi:hypothetical protein